MGDIFKKVAKLIDVKSIVTLVLTGVFSALACKNIITGDQFLTVFTVIISFYFGTQAVKKQDTETKSDNTGNVEG